MVPWSGSRSQVAWRVQFQAASTDHRAFDQQEGTSSSLMALDVKTVQGVLDHAVARVASWSSWSWP
jgi:hypothetical protein